ncbi:Nn.00g043810.m01.CDS01 [Neocucurbitaria sp. VM-36]
MTSVRSPFEAPNERLATYFDAAQPEPRATFEDRDIDDIALLLQQCGHVASRCPRTYILFRMIGHLDVLEQLVQAGFSDQWFPVETRSLPSFLEPSVKAAVVQQQGIILTKSLDLENGRHRHFAPDEALPFEIHGRLGSGGYGQVDRIVSKTSFRHYALKRIRRRAAFGNRSSREAVKGFLTEMQIMRSLEHKHIVQYIGSYTDKSYLGLVMSPVAETDLATYNERLCSHLQAVQDDRTVTPIYLQHQPAAAEMSSNLMTYFGCLTAALTYLHNQNIRHKDIKPQNILVAKGNVLLADFGLARDFSDDVGSTTSGLTSASPRYCAPEVAMYEARNTSSDIWSLGCVFLEMTAALQGLNIGWIKEFYTKCHSQSPHFHANPAATAQLIQKLGTTAQPRHKRMLIWIEQMVRVDRTARPKAPQILEMITVPDASDVDATPNMFCGICCVPDLESDSLDSLADEFDNMTASLPSSHLKKDAVAQDNSVRHKKAADNGLDSKTSVRPLDAASEPETETKSESIASSKGGVREATAYSNATANAEVPRSPSLETKTVPSAVTFPETERTVEVPRLPGRETNVGPKAATSASMDINVVGDMSRARTYAADPARASVRDSGKPRTVTSPTYSDFTTIKEQIDQPTLEKTKTNRDNERRTLQIEYVAPRSQAVRGKALPPTATIDETERALIDACKVDTVGLNTQDSPGPVTSPTHSSSNERNVVKVPSENVELAKVKRLPQKVFGTPLSVSIQYAYFELKHFRIVSNAYLPGPIPIVVAKCGSFMRSNLATGEDADYFSDCGGQLTDESLIDMFNNSEAEFGWNLLNLHDSLDCGKLLYQFFSNLPEPLIPTDIARTIVDGFRLGHQRRHRNRIRILQETILNIPSPNRLTILYMLDLFTFCLMHSTTTSQIIAEKYRTCFLSEPREDFEEGRVELERILKFMVDQAKELLGDSISSGSEVQPRVFQALPHQPDADEPAEKAYDASATERPSDSPENQAALISVTPNPVKRARQEMMEPSAPKYSPPQRFFRPAVVQYVTALYDFDAAKSGKEGVLSFKKYDKIRIIPRTDNSKDWWYGELHGKRGNFPTNYTTLPEDILKQPWHYHGSGSSQPVLEQPKQHRTYRPTDRYVSQTKPRLRNETPRKQFTTPYESEDENKNAGNTSGFRKTLRKLSD